MAGLQRARARKQAVLRRVVVTVVAIGFALPLVGMLEFTTRGPGGTRSMDTWRTVLDLPGLRTDYPQLWSGLKASAGLVVLTVLLTLVLLVPTMTWVRLRLPALRRPLEFVCLLPLTLPAIVLVVGLAPVYRYVSYNLRWVPVVGGESSIWLCFAYVILVLPYSYRALDAGLSAIDVRTLSEAARSLGASWFTVMLRVILPNVRSAVLSASFLTVALVLGEFTIASLLNRDNLQVGINLLGGRDSQVAVAVSFAALALAFVLMLVLSLAGGRRPRTAASPAAPAPVTAVPITAAPLVKETP